jgi:hypothetical protein
LTSTADSLACLPTGSLDPSGSGPQLVAATAAGRALPIGIARTGGMPRTRQSGMDLTTGAQRKIRASVDVGIGQLLRDRRHVPGRRLGRSVLEPIHDRLAALER